MIQEGHADYATPEDIKGLDDSLLDDISKICEVQEYAPEECIPCLAETTLLDRTADRMALERTRVWETESAQVEARKAAEVEADQVDAYAPYASPRLVEEEEEEEGEFKPRLAASLAAVPPWHEEVEDPESVADQFASKVVELNLLVEELLNGPPIPPPGVSLEDLALLTLAADKWVQMSEIQGGLAPQQQQMLDATKDLVSRLRS